MAKYRSIHGEGLKVFSPKQTLQRLPIALAQVKAVNTSENLLSKSRQIIYLWIEQKKLVKKYTTI